MTDHEGPEGPPPGLASVLHASDQLAVAAAAVATVAVHLLEVDAVGLALHGRDGGVTRLSATSGLIGRLDRIQADLGQGPGLASFDVGSERFVADVRVDQRYPEWSRAAAQLGMLSVHMTALAPLRDFGVSLDLYSHRAGGIGAVTVAAVAALALPAALDLDAVGRLRSVQDSLRTRELVGQAQGIIMERRGLSALQAMEVLRRESREDDTTLRALSLAVTEGTALLGAPDAVTATETEP